MSGLYELKQSVHEQELEDLRFADQCQRRLRNAEDQSYIDEGEDDEL